ncbi:MAG TPA: LytR C-terminal domain-containing protein [Actinomycetota bacterium]|jgi:hypothetical protein|nr:LytR C-terminal domain-containing protein [Actinomycetota bacterium]
MARHAPPTNRSFYLSVAASTIRFALIVALVVGGVVVINQAFPDTTTSGGGGATGEIPTGGPGPTETGPTAATGATGDTGQQPANTPTPQIEGVRVAVFNTTGVTGLAGDLMLELEADGYERGEEPGDAPASANTRIYFRSAADRVEAEYIANTYFRRLEILPTRLEAGADVDPSVQVAIFLGNDYAAIA